MDVTVDDRVYHLNDTAVQRSGLLRRLCDDGLVGPMPLQVQGPAWEIWLRGEADWKAMHTPQAFSILTVSFQLRCCQCRHVRSNAANV